MAARRHCVVPGLHAAGYLWRNPILDGRARTCACSCLLRQGAHWYCTKSRSEWRDPIVRFPAGCQSALLAATSRRLHFGRETQSTPTLISVARPGAGSQRRTL